MMNMMFMSPELGTEPVCEILVRSGAILQQIKQQLNNNNNNNNMTTKQKQMQLYSLALVPGLFVLGISYLAKPLPQPPLPLLSFFLPPLIFLLGAGGLREAWCLGMRLLRLYIHVRICEYWM